MKKLINPGILALLFCSCSYAQDMGFRTTDIGGEYQWYPRGSIYNLHIAFNAKLNHSLQLRLGYNHVPVYHVDGHNESGKGWGGGLGYRYYFKPFPYKFFIGARADVWLMKVNVDYGAAAGPYVVVDKPLILQPALEAGYTFVINDIVYITPYASAGLQTDFGKMGATVKYGNGFVPTAGISAGFRL
ncbi:MAG TPA: hypothetical protein VIV35_10755 [Chitinophagaceae bacterium]